MEKLLNLASVKFNQASSLFILSGAGMGVDSGLPDFRGPKGFWKNYPLYKKQGVRFEEMANPVHFNRDPKFAWGFYGHRLNLYRKTEPHRGFQILINIAAKFKLPYFSVTSNVDGHFQKAGYKHDSILEVHGSINHLQCSIPCSGSIWGNSEKIKVDFNTMRAAHIPKCIECNAAARPNILMFGDFHFVNERCAEQHDKFDSFLMNKVGKSPLVIEIGAGTSVPTIRYYAEKIVYTHKNGFLLRINPRDSAIDGRGLGIPMNALDTMVELENRLLC
jgi:NAD-dependent SIR2 family protein deacetylase